MNEIELLRRRFLEYFDRSCERGIWEFSDFLSLAEQSELFSMRLGDCILSGGYEASERKMAIFGSEENFGYPAPAPIACVKIEPVNAKFADALTHRDYLGSLMALGVERSTMGDILIRERTAYVICKDAIAPYLIENLTQVKHTSVKCALSEIPDFANVEPPISAFVVASERLDAVLAGVFDLARSESKKAVESGFVFLDGRQVTNASSELREGVIVSLRGTGRFRYEGIERETRRGRLRVLTRKY